MCISQKMLPLICIYQQIIYWLIGMYQRAEYNNSAQSDACYAGAAGFSRYEPRNKEVMCLEG